MFLKLIKGQRNISDINLETAKTIAQLIKKQYPSAAVFIIGSVLKPALIHHGSDIDIMVKGIEESDYIRLIKFISHKFPSLNIDIRRIEELNTYKQQKIIEKGYKVDDEFKA